MWNIKEKAKNYLKKADDYFSAGEIEKAQVYYQKALCLDPENFDCYYQLGFVCYMLEDYRKAMECYRKEAELRPKDFDRYDLLGYACFKEEEYGLAKEYLEKAMTLDYYPSSFEFYKELVFTCLKLGEYDLAIKYWEQNEESDLESDSDRSIDEVFVNPKNNSFKGDC